jgi:Hemolysins and related proteins containing CBS domains
MQLGVTLTSLAIGAIGEQALSKLFDEFLATVLAVVLAYLLLTFCTSSSASSSRRESRSATPRGRPCSSSRPFASSSSSCGR